MIASNRYLKAQRRQSLSSRCSTSNGWALYVLFRQLGYYRLMPRYSASSDVKVRRKREEIIKSPEKVLKKAQNGKEFDV